MNMVLSIVMTDQSYTHLYIYMYECVYKHKAIILQIIEHKHAYIIIYNAIKILASLS